MENEPGGNMILGEPNVAEEVFGGLPPANSSNPFWADWNQLCKHGYVNPSFNPVSNSTIWIIENKNSSNIKRC